MGHGIPSIGCSQHCFPLWRSGRSDRCSFFITCSRTLVRKSGKDAAWPLPTDTSAFAFTPKGKPHKNPGQGVGTWYLGGPWRLYPPVASSDSGTSLLYGFHFLRRYIIFLDRDGRGSPVVQLSGSLRSCWGVGTTALLLSSFLIPSYGGVVLSLARCCSAGFPARSSGTPGVEVGPSRCRLLGLSACTPGLLDVAGPIVLEKTLNIL